MKLLTKAELPKAIESIANRGNKLDADIHIAACSSLSIFAEHGDTGFVNRLYNALPKGTRKQAMTSWLISYGQLSANTESTKGEQPFVKDANKAATRLDEAIADPWFDHKPDPKPDEVFDLMAAVSAIIKKAKGKQLAHAELLAPLQAIVAMENVLSPTANEDSNKSSSEEQTDETIDPRNVGIDVARSTIDGIPAATALQ